LITTLVLSPYSPIIFTQQKAEAQAYLQTIKYRNLVIDLDNGVKPMLSYLYLPLAMSHFTAALLISDSGALNMNETLVENAKPYWEISQYLLIPDT
jgi:hypothetical protein